MFFRKRQKPKETVPARLAETLAASVIRRQRAMADWLNHLVNQQPPAIRRRLLWGWLISGCLALAFSVRCSLQGHGLFFVQPRQAAAHLGLPADMVRGRSRTPTEHLPFYSSFK